jgi:hypothetical protein
MIVDVILDRQGGASYSPLLILAYTDNRVYGDGFEYILHAFQDLSESEVKKALKRYIDEQRYNPEIKKYIDSVDWLMEQRG